MNALLNYLYAILEAEARIAWLTLGLDPGVGVLYANLRVHHSLHLDLMEPMHPRINEFVLILLEQRVFYAKDFFEAVQGNCRLMLSITTPMAEYAPGITLGCPVCWRRRASTWAQASLERKERAQGSNAVHAGEPMCRA